LALSVAAHVTAILVGVFEPDIAAIAMLTAEGRLALPPLGGDR
jgi:hypothetical protein